jgi:hypothetical protein
MIRGKPHAVEGGAIGASSHAAAAPEAADRHQVTVFKPIRPYAACVSLLIALGWYLGGCVAVGTQERAAPRPTRTGEAVATAGADDPIPAALLQAQIQGIYDIPIRLSDGRYAGPAFAAGGSSRPTVTLLQAPMAHGDLDADGVDDFAVILIESSGGSGSFTYLALLRPDEGTFFNVATKLLGDRVKVDSLTMEDGAVRATLVTHGPEDVACCPSQQTERAWRLDADQLIEVRTPEAFHDPGRN